MANRAPATSFHDDRVIVTAAGRLFEDQEQRDHGEGRDHQQLEIIDMRNDLGLRRDHGIEGGASNPTSVAFAIEIRSRMAARPGSKRHDRFPLRETAHYAREKALSGIFK
jgi:hypothetical protein